MQAWTNYMTPGKFHELLAKGNGEWSEDISMWMDPTAAPTTTTATSSNKMILGGRYQYSTISGTMMGMPFEGISIVGYDNAKKMFVNTWIDNFGTGISNMEGTLDEATNTITFTGKQIDPMTGKEMGIKQILKIIDSDNQYMEMYAINNGQEMKTMEIRSTKK